MQFYLAPMEGVTSQVYRRVYASMFSNVDKYFTPFLSPTKNHKLKSREEKEIAPENNAGTVTVPQVLTNRADYFVRLGKELAGYGYQEVNFNLGCPSPTVVTKKKGAGFLEDPEQMDALFRQIFEDGTIKVSVKTRIGIEELWEWEDILAVYEKYPFTELIIHPRLQKQMYQGKPDIASFAKAVSQLKVPVCYNGDIFSVADYEQLMTQFPDLQCVMLGRGVIANPALIAEIKGEDKRSKELFKEFHDRLYQAYLEEMDCERDALFKMKEVWYYMGQMFINADAPMKKVKKAVKDGAYRVAVSNLFAKCELKEQGGFLGN